MEQQYQAAWAFVDDNWDKLEIVRDVIVNAIYALVILIVALIVSGWIRRRILRVGERSRHFDMTLASFLGNVARYGVLVLALIFVLNRFGIETTSLAALIGAAGLAIGLALQGTLSHLASGVMLVAFRPLEIGQFVEAGGESGTVSNISLFNTELTTVDNVQVILPNGTVWGNVIKNYSHFPTRRCDLVIGVGYDSDLKKTEEVLWSLINADDRVLPAPEPFCKLTNLGDSSVDFTLRLWCKADDLWNLKFDLTRQIKDAFDANGIQIPYPTRTLVVEKTAAPEATP
ncbi:small conductance mechanosensitive channel [Poseidonocella pacifica]|uniref:Small-conductance mechanosensitive channel n=1 Tax=Poseidonocella pacifica TaxID=871651 RepID=A0A1I0Y265_9RHOB|nr:mechanosensitive ion channel domain-containing protein [Poseidonocella pacifica]SFB06293.1 small conductance mechanosensitive channel [Poseidonocella pacifica]